MQTPIYLVVETSGSNAEHDYAKLEKFLEEAYEEEMIVDGTIAQDSSQQAAIWALRENISEGLRHAGKPLLPILLLLPNQQLPVWLQLLLSCCSANALPNICGQLHEQDMPALSHSVCVCL